MRTLKIYTVKERMPKDYERILVWGTVGFGEFKEEPFPEMDTVRLFKGRDPTIDENQHVGKLQGDGIPFDLTMRYSLADEVLDCIIGEENDLP